MPAFCRDCLSDSASAGGRCRACGSPRVVGHPKIDTLSIAHIDCDAFYAAIEKRDDPSIADKPVIIGGGKRGVVSTACYIARTYGVKSAMPMFKALALCPHATIVRPRMSKYVEVGREVRRRMHELTPMVEPLSIDEAFLDLSGTELLHGMSPARSLARLAKAIEKDIGISISVGLSGNKFLAKIASDLDKPRGFSVLAPEEAPAFLAPKPVGFIWGIGKASEAKLARDGYVTIADLQRADETDLMRRYGPEGLRLSRLSRGIDVRRVSPDRDAKTVSAETTFETDTGDHHALERILWPLCEKVSGRLKAAAIAGSTVTLKLKTHDFKLRTRAATLSYPTQLANEIFETGRQLLGREIGSARFRLLGIGVSNFVEAENAVRDLIETAVVRTGAREKAIDRLREKFGQDAVVRGISFDNGKR
ncbi:DNA polymerase IV [Variibacter gotjawalensis]|uniref:DNA polymerase IV n=1 Tax=Variibacter gotjawalensis TaxID=1333996 RepID=A0A0S3PWD0_9BRAD|nr:DNA polymerase IV [Variibacter gotjawalensis]NIK46037.1 DNA polymerase-4 [Variibacter gotjawalensis]RZS47955.1 DNA polymerase-4 [Variibacter gotjawalensis]BAT60211.1 DNA polymerase IV [Variibacter gotjawalensis]